MENYTSRNADKFVLRMPEGLRDQIKDMAQANRRSMNQQLLVMLTNQSESIPVQPEETWIPQIGQLVQLRDSFKVSDNVEMGVIVGFVRVKGVLCARIETEGSSTIVYEDLNKICPVRISL